MPDPVLPEYGTGSLADLVPSLFSALGVSEFSNPLSVEPATSVVLVLIDGLGWESLLSHPLQAPFMASLAGHSRSLTTGFPSTTVTSMTCIGTATPPGRHGMVGYTFAAPGRDAPFNALTWRLLDDSAADMLAAFPPETAQPITTAFERAASAGVDVIRLGEPRTANSGLSRAAFRGGRFRPVYTMSDLLAETLSIAGSAERSFVLSYHPALDTVGHLRGVDSEAWRIELGHCDSLASAIAERTLAGSLLVIAGDHGMVDVAESERSDLEDHPELLSGVRFLGGEGRSRHIYTKPGADDDVIGAWRSFLGDAALVVAKDEAVASGWFGPTVEERVRGRIGDVIMAALEPVSMVQRNVDPFGGRLRGNHGSLTAQEVLVPFLTFRAEG